MAFGPYCVELNNSVVLVSYTEWLYSNRFKWFPAFRTNTPLSSSRFELLEELGILLGL